MSYKQLSYTDRLLRVCEWYEEREATIPVDLYAKLEANGIYL
jgi:hypothetical protein